MLDFRLPRLHSRVQHPTLFLLLNGSRQKLEHLIFFLSGLMAGGTAPSLVAAEVDESRLPPPAKIQVNFARDIKPILDTSCVRCHGPERPRSGFRLDNRVSALKGGKNGVDILPGNSAKSPLIHYVARVVPDIEMPPEGKGEPLSSDQVGQLRAWIDQGAVWEETEPTNLFDVRISPTVGSTFVNGDKNQFRAHYWQPDGVNGGLESFDLFTADRDTKLEVSGRLRRDDYRIVLNLDRNDVGFIHSGWDQFRKYYDDTGGYYAYPVPRLPQSLGTDLHLDQGKAWVDFGLTLPRWPRMVVGYEYDYRRGEEATTSWGSDGFPGDARNIAPTSKHIDEGVNIIKFDLDAEVQGVTIEDRFRGEFYRLNTSYTNLAARGFSQDAHDANTYFQGANSIRLEKKFKDWLFTSGGYFYSKLNADDTFTDATAFNNTVYLASVPNIVLERESHVFNVNALLGPFGGLTLSTGVQSEWTRQEGMGSGLLNGIAYARPPSANFDINPATLASDYDQNTISETVGVRYTKIPFTALFADARFRQETIGQSNSDIQPAPAQSFLENTSFRSSLADFRLGFSTSPWQSVTLSAHYRRYDDDSHYKTNQVSQPIGGYPGLLSWRDLVTDEVETKLVLHPVTWLKTTLTYQLLSTDYKQDTRPAYDVGVAPPYSDGGFILAGKYDAHIYSIGATLTPSQRLSFSGTFSYQDSTTTTAGGDLITPYKGSVYSALVGASYILNRSTDLLFNYGFSFGDYSQPDSPINPNSPPPLGIRYQQQALQAAVSHRLSKRLSTRLQFGFYYYDEPTTVSVNNYQAYSIFGTLTYRLR
jgi:hypothetical protein